MSTIVIADDHVIVAQGIASILDVEHTVIGVANSGKELIEMVRDLKPDLAVTDVNMPGLSGISAIAEIRHFNKDIPIICLTMHDEAEYAESALSAGANGYVLKHQAGGQLLEAIDTVLNGEHYVSESIALEENPIELTPRQLSVLRLLAEGKSAKVVANELCISSRTVEFHKYSMIKTLGLKNSADLIQYAISRGLSSH